MTQWSGGQTLIQLIVTFKKHLSFLKNLKNNLPLLVALDTFDDARELALVEGTGEAKAASK